MKNSFNYFVSGSFAFLGVLCITSGVAIPKLAANTETNSVVKLSVTQKQVSFCKSNEIKLADINVEVNNPLSTNAKDYLKTPNDIDTSIINRLKLDTSNVNVNQVGSYTYTITYNKKIYNGTVNVKAKALPQVDIMTLKSLSFETNTKLSLDVTTYIKEQLAPEVVAAVRLDISNVDVTKPGRYLYSISYNGKLYTNTITIYEPKFGTTTNDSTIKDNTVNKEDSNTNTNINTKKNS